MFADITPIPIFARIDRDALGVAPGLQLAATYVREVEANIRRVWENVFGWEHFPALHAEYFCDVRLLEEHARGWRVAVTRQPGGPNRRIVIELDAEREPARYRVRIMKGQAPAPRSGSYSLPATPIARLSRSGSIYRSRNSRSLPRSARPTASPTQGCGTQTSA
jgi:hypothetical protein